MPSLLTPKIPLKMATYLPSELKIYTILKLSYRMKMTDMTTIQPSMKISVLNSMLKQMLVMKP